VTFALIYARASSDPSDQRISVDRQVKLCTARAEELWPSAEVRVFRDDGITAADPDVHRPGFAGFLEAVRIARKGAIAGVVVNEQSRLTRQGTGAWDELVVTLTRSGVTKVETLRAGPISVEPGSRLAGRILAVVDAEEVERTTARTRDAHRELFEEGRPSGGPPFGYRSTKDSAGRPAFEVDETEAPIVREAFEMALAGHAVSAIVEQLNATGVPPRSARWKFGDGRKLTEWRATTVRHMLRSPSVAGLRSHTDPDGQTRTVAARWAAIVAVERWHQVQRVLGQPGIVVGVNGRSYPVRTQPVHHYRGHLLSARRHQGEVHGVLRCAKCGSPMLAQTQTRRNGPRVAGYSCQPKVGGCGGVSITPAGDLEELVVTAIQRRLIASPGLRQRLDAAQHAEAAQWRAERDAARARTLEAGEMFGLGVIDRPTFEVMHAPAKAALDLAERKLASMVATDVVLPSASDVTEGWATLTLRQQRSVVERLIGRIVIHPAKGGGRGFDPDRVGVPEWLG
jgi:DNA invertase Pin-like site-specific DNA recombinase